MDVGSGYRANLGSHAVLPSPPAELPLPLLGTCLLQDPLSGVGSAPVLVFLASNMHLSLCALYSDGPIGTLGKL